MKSVHFGFGLSFCNGNKPSVGVNRHGDVVLVHEAAGGEKRYHVGRLSDATIRWGACEAAGSGQMPRVALNNDGVAVEVHWNPQHKKMYCRAARVRAGDDVTWPDADAYAEGGDRAWPVVSLNDGGTVVEVHEVREGRGRNRKIWLEYGVGRLRQTRDTPGVQWAGPRFRRGEAATPAIAINNHGTIVEIHRYPYGSDRRLFYRIGRIVGAEIAFEERHVLGHGFHPSVSITDEGLVILVLRAVNRSEVHQRVGHVAADGKTIAWDGAVYFDDGTVPAVAASETMAVEVHEHERQPELRFSTSLLTDRASWMQNRLDILGKKPLRELVLPASHDAGMYRSNIPGHARNQSLSIYEQLRYGVRYFELRPMWGFIGTGDLLIHHGGIPGPTLRTVLNDVAQFAAQGHRELVILKFSHFRSIDDDQYRRFVRQVDETIGKWLVTRDRIPRRERLAGVTLNEYVQDGPAILAVVEANRAIDIPHPGIWVYREWHEADNGDLCVFDRFANTDDFAEMRQDQFDKFAAYDGNMRNGKLPCDLFLLSWTLTPQAVRESVPLPIFSNLPFANRSVVIPATPRQLSRRANPRLGHDLHLGGPPPDLPAPRIPNEAGRRINLLFVDYVETARVTDVAIFLNGAHGSEPSPPKRG